MKKTVSLLLAVMMVLALISGCAPAPTTSAPTTSAPTTPASTTPPTPTPAPAPVAKNLRCGITVAEDSNSAKALRIFEKSVEKDSAGRLSFELFLNGTLGNERDMIEGLTLGTQEMVACSTAPLISFAPDFMIWDLPYIVANTKDGLKKAYDFMDGEAAKAMLASLESKGIKGLAFTHNGFRYCLNRKKDVAVPADMKGLKIRTMENNIHLAVYKAVGANPVAMASTEAFTALQQGVIDGMDNNLDALYTQGAWETAKHLTLTGHVFSAATILISSKTYNSLSDADKKIVTDSAKMAAQEQRKIAEARESEVIEKFKTQCGVKVTGVNVDDWRNLVHGIWDEYRNKIDAKYFDAMTK